MLNKILKIIGSTCSACGNLICCSLFFKDQIKAKITAAINKKVDIVSFEDADLSLFKNFPMLMLLYINWTSSTKLLLKAIH
jgi:hypothetical protein